MKTVQTPSSAVNTKNDRVTSLPGKGPVGNVQFAGYSPMSNKESLFYWFVGAEDYANQTTIIWTNGGPGSSSFWGFFYENGPYIIDPDKVNLANPVLHDRSWAWNNKANYMIFEHPLSVTYSFAQDDADVPKSPEQGAAEYYTALQNFLDKHPEIRKNKIILCGESYAGTYLPLIADCIYKGNTGGAQKIDLASVVLLDAWVDPTLQMSMDTQYAYNHGLISKKQKAYFDENYKGKDLNKLNWAIHEMCGVYMTNIAKKKDPPFPVVLDYLNRSDVRAALHIDPNMPLITQGWSKTVSANYTPHVNNNYAPLVDELLIKAPFKIQVINGLNDAKDCNFLGTEAWLETLTSEAAKQYHAKDQVQWKESDSGYPLGFVQDGGKLSWVKVLNAGHMAVGDQPAILDIVLKKSNE